MMEVALCLAIIGFALVSILAVLPLGMGNQQRTRQATLISQDATMFLESIRDGAHGMNDLTNYVVAITNYFQYYKLGQPDGRVNVAGYTYSASSINNTPAPGLLLTNGLRIIGLLSTPEFTTWDSPNGIAGPGGLPVTDTFYGTYISNRVYAYVRSFSGMAAEKPPQNNDILRDASFSYRMLCVNAPVTESTNLMAQMATNAGAVYDYDQQLAGNLRQLRLEFRWPLLPNLSVAANPQIQNFRTDVAGQMLLTNDYPNNPGDGMWLYFCQSQSFTNSP